MRMCTCTQAHTYAYTYAHTHIRVRTYNLLTQLKTLSHTYQVFGLLAAIKQHVDVFVETEVVHRHASICVRQ